MKNIVHFIPRPSQNTLAGDVHTYEPAKEPPLPQGYSRMTTEEFAAWEAAEKAAGWKPEYPEHPVAAAEPTVEQRLAAVEARTTALESEIDKLKAAKP